METTLTTKHTTKINKKPHNSLKRSILITDFTCPYPYDYNTLDTEGLGGTEATVLRIAKGLSKHYDVYIMQHNRKKDVNVNESLHLCTPLILDKLHGPISVINLRSVLPLPFLRDKYPDTNLILWLHDLEQQNGQMVQHRELIENMKLTIVTVSNYHLTQITDIALQRRFDWPNYVVKRIYNPIEPKLKPGRKKVDPNKLVFFSSPHKGLDVALKKFSMLQTYYPKLSLYVSNPGYIASNLESKGGVVNLGSLAHKDIIEHVKTAFCVFYPNTNYSTRETFGLIFAEANAVGTPVLTHGQGAAREVLSDSDQIVDCTNDLLLKDRFTKWVEQGRPKVYLKDTFKLDNVIHEWLKIIQK